MTRQLVLLTLGLFALGSAAHSAPAGELIPFNGREVGVLFLEGLDLDLGIIVVGYEGHGRGTVVGNYTTRSSTVIEIATGNILSISVRYRAANGDEICVSQVPSGIPPNPFTVLNHATITGGTGRFAGAHGHYDLVLVGDEPLIPENLPIATKAEYRGVISSPGANR